MALLAPLIQSADILKIEEVIQIVKEACADICAGRSTLLESEKPYPILTTVEGNPNMGEQS